MAHWHDFNPWADRLIYVPDLEEFLECLYYPDNAQHYRDKCTHYYDKVDAYILLQPSGMHSGGIRYGREGNEYLSPYMNSAALERLARKYAPERFSTPPGHRRAS